jgi:hypothetical protein
MKKLQLTAFLAIVMIWPAVAHAETYIYGGSYPGIYGSYSDEAEAWLDNYQYNRAILRQDREEQRQWDRFAKTHALPIARPDEPQNAPGFKIVHPPK